MVIGVCPRCQTLSFFDCNPSSERRVSFLSGASETFLGRFLSFSAILLVAVAYSVATVAPPFSSSQRRNVATDTRFKNSGILQNNETYLAVIGLINTVRTGLTRA